MKVDPKLIRRYHVDTLEDRHDELWEQSLQASDEYAMIEAELDRRSDQQVLMKARQEKIQKLAEDERAARSVEIAALLKAENYTTLIAKYGADYEHDYSVSGNIVESHVARDWQNQTWICDTTDEALAKVRQLIGWRIYDDYSR